MESPTVLIGLGNPGAEYASTYHNIGMAAVDAIAADIFGDANVPWETHQKLFSYARTGNWAFVKPLTFMNDSGRAVREAVRKFNAAPEDIVLLHDDSDLLVGEWKMSRGRGAAGHHGVESAIAALGTNQFLRVRIGIRPPEERTREKAGSFVLHPVQKSSEPIFAKIFDEIAEALAEPSTQPLP